MRERERERACVHTPTESGTPSRREGQHAARHTWEMLPPAPAADRAALTHGCQELADLALRSPCPEPLFAALDQPGTPGIF